MMIAGFLPVCGAAGTATGLYPDDIPSMFPARLMAMEVSLGSGAVRVSSFSTDTSLRGSPPTKQTSGRKESSPPYPWTSLKELLLSIVCIPSWRGE